jgi:anti-anti-sigma regulatory factor
MGIISIQKQGHVPVTILQLSGKLDGSNYTELIDHAHKAYLSGVKYLLLDLSGLTYMSSAGLAAIHRTALMFRGIFEGDENGWASYHAIDRDRDRRDPQYVKLLSPQQEVARVLDITGFNSLFETYTNLDSAIASF